MRNKKDVTPYWKRLTDISKYVQKMEEKWKEHYNVYESNLLYYPPQIKDKNIFV